MSWREAKLSLAHAQGSRTPVYAGSIEGGVEEAGRQLLSCAVRAGWFWHPAPDPEFRIDSTALAGARDPRPMSPWQGWLPWLIVSVVVIAWTHFKYASIGQQNIAWPGLHNAISITLYNNKPYAAIWAFQPLGTGTAILLAAVMTALVVRLSASDFFGCVAKTMRQAWLAVVTVMLIIGLAYLMNYSGIAYTLGQAAASTGHLFVLLSPFLGWVAVMLSGSDTSGNALATCKWSPRGSSISTRCCSPPPIPPAA